MNENPLSKFTDDDLLAELVRRRNVRERTVEPEKWCEDCKHFKYWEGRGDPPDDYNPCRKERKMKFFMPEAPHDPFGYYLRICADREARPEPSPPPRSIPKAVP